MKTKEIKDIAAIELAMQQKGTSKKQFVRLQVVLWRAQGKSLKEVMELSGISQSAIKSYCAKYRAGGVDALESKYAGGNFRKLSFEEEAAALEKCEEIAEKGGYVRVAELQEAFEKEAGVHYHLHVFYRLLKRHGWRKVKPRGKHPKKASDEAIEASKKLTKKLTS